MVRPRILVIDDENTVITVFRKGVTRKDYDLVSAADGREGLDQLRAQEPDVVFSDIRMPNMDGLEFLEEARSVSPDVPVVLITGFGDKEKLTRALQLGAFDLIDKPFDVKSVQLVLERALRHHRSLVQRRRIENFARSINAAQTLDDLFDYLASNIGTALGVRLFSLFLYDNEAERLSLACTNHVPLPAGLELALADVRDPMKGVIASRTPYVAKEATTHLSTDAKQRARYLDDTAAVMPLLIRDRLIGVLNLNDKLEGPSPFDDTDLAFLTIAAELLASAIAVRQETVRLKETQQRLIQSEKLAAVTKLIAGVAHELKTPLTSLRFAVVNFGKALQSPKAYDADSATRRLLSLHEDIDRLQERVERFLSFSRPERVERESCRPAEIVEEVVRRASALLQDRGVELDLTCDREMPTLQVDRQGFIEAVLNLLVNAIEAVGDAGRVDLSVTSDAGKVRVRVTDSGPGVPEEIASQVFELFFTTKSKGSGIGLSQVHLFCDTHGGRVSFESGAGGTTFVMELPASRTSGGVG